LSRAERRVRRTEEPQPLGAVLDGLGGEPRLASGLLLGNLGRRWDAVVGERLAEESAPAALEGGVLVVKASSAPWAAQIKFLAKEIREASNRVLGEGTPPGTAVKGLPRALPGNPIREVRVVVDPGPRSR
jgi:predicted nucleic acid-binding Zn ribbon protein